MRDTEPTGSARDAVPCLSVVLPMLDEAAGIEVVLGALQSMRAAGVEVIVVDGGSTDDSVERARPWADRVLLAPRGRASQMNAGAAVARGAALLFLHADTRLPDGALGLIEGAMGLSSAPVRAPALWGRFDVRILGRPRMLRVVAAMMNARSRLTGIATGDQAIFVRREAFDRAGGFPAQPLMEDIELSKRLLQLGRPACLCERVSTSGRRWETRGVWRTIFLMWRLRWRYWCGESAQSIADAYR